MRRRRRVRTALLVVVLVVISAGIGGYWYARPLLLTGTGYAAHNACAVVHVADRSDPVSDLPPNPLVPYLHTTTSRVGAGSSVLGVLAGQDAWATSHGCVVAGERPANAWTVTDRTPLGRNPFTSAEAPRPDPDVDAAIARAFGDDLTPAERRRLGTRAVVVVRDGRIVGERYAAGFTPTTRQLGWSMSKSVTNLLVGRLVAEGRIAVDDDHLRPEWQDARAAITVDDLMRMTSGLQWDETYDLGTPITRMLYLEPDMARYAASLPLAHPVGTHQQYSSGSTTLLCGILGARTGAGADLPRRQLFAPLGLSSAVLETDAAGTPVCSSYLWATPRDWAALGQFALDDGVWGGDRLLPEGWMQQSTTVHPVASSDEQSYAAGWRVNRLPTGGLVDPQLPEDAYWASGHDGQRMVIVPSQRLVVVRLGFSPEVSGDDGLRVSRLVRDLVPATA